MFKWYSHTRTFEAGLFAISVTILLGLAVVGVTHSSYSNSFFLAPNSTYTIQLRGYQWESIYIEIKSSTPVTVCITDSVGLRLLHSGEGALCYLYKANVTKFDEYWRFPTSKRLYLLIISKGEAAKVKVNLRMGVLTW
ncbi:hypothetical protein [Thermococcus sp.]